ncbi:MAG: META domain-containing protein [Tannerellaceae bacterium]|jgi:heat shock protein HslJ|nr:META domain-containing protein [Tannerellaceae bacterium]
MKEVLFYVLMIPIMFGMASCSSANKADVKNLDGKWTIVEVKGLKVERENMPYIEFNMTENKVHGNAGCNMFNTVIIPDAKDISAFTLKPAAATMMACLDMKLEDVILSALETITNVQYGSSANEMKLVDKNGNVILVLSKN